MSRLVSFLGRSWPGSPTRLIDRFAKRPAELQRAVLRGLLTKASGTEWGLRYGFAELATRPDVVAAYQAAMPLHDYGEIQSDVERIRSGTPDVMWPGKFVDFAVSSGTASAGKIIPVSQDMLSYNRRFSLGMMYSYLAEKGAPQFLVGKLLSLPGLIEEDPRFPGTLVGEVSGLQARYAPPWVARLYQAVPQSILNIPNWEEKLTAIVERTVDMDIRAIAMVPTWALVLFDKLIEHYNRRNADRTVSTVAEIWPNLQVFFSGGVALASYQSLLKEQIGRDIDFVEAYGASEGFFAFSQRPDEDDMIVHLQNGVFYEFVRQDEQGDPQARRYWIDTVEPDVRYAVFVSTCSGLWSYGVGDVVRFTRMSPPRLVVAGRTSEMIDRYGEAVFGEEARDALARACEATGAVVLDYHVAPSNPTHEQLPRHQWLVEFDKEPNDLNAFGNALDAHLRNVNRHYAIRREAVAFDPPAVVALPRGSFYAWLQASRSRVSAQTKVPRMSDERVIADGVLEISES